MHLQHALFSDLATDIVPPEVVIDDIFICLGFTYGTVPFVSISTWRWLAQRRISQIFDLDWLHCRPARAGLACSASYIREVV